ncbi:MAG TPA: glycosyltransferase [Segetibacter sp.]|jgi:glycosyltransferase involved in cell wall biosynthesis
MSERKKLLIVYDYFYPGFRAGGPIQSLTNLVTMLVKNYDVYVLTGAYDLEETIAYNSITVNTWNTITLPGSVDSLKVFYKDKKSITKKALRDMIDSISPQIIYLNGIYSYNFFILPILALRSLASHYKIIVCPRGMLKQGALSSKAFKKSIYLTCLRASGLLNKVTWHATGTDEAENIKAKFKNFKSIILAPNIPKLPFANITYRDKLSPQLNLVYLSLINEHKNLLLLLNLIQELPNVTLDVYGPVIDKNYWQQCEQVIKMMPDKIAYKGEVQPPDVQLLLSRYHALILFTKGENFGHAIYESLSVGRPVLISNYTPWHDLKANNAGTNMDINNPEDCKRQLNEFVNMGQQEYNRYCKGANTLATAHYNALNAEAMYFSLFA